MEGPGNKLYGSWAHHVRIEFTGLTITRWPASALYSDGTVDELSVGFMLFVSYPIPYIPVICGDRWGNRASRGNIEGHSKLSALRLCVGTKCFSFLFFFLLNTVCFIIIASQTFFLLDFEYSPRSGENSFCSGDLCNSL